MGEEQVRGLVASVRAFAPVTGEPNQEEQEAPPLAVTLGHSKQGQEEGPTLAEPTAIESKELPISPIFRKMDIRIEVRKPMREAWLRRLTHQ